MNEQVHQDSQRDLTITVDRDLCIGAASCNVMAPRTFGLDNEGKVVILPPDHDSDEDIFAAAAACPVRAIKVARRNGEALA